MKRLLSISVTAATGRLLATQTRPSSATRSRSVARRNTAPEVDRRAGTGIPIVAYIRTLWRKAWQDLMAMASGTRLLVVLNRPGPDVVGTPLRAVAGAPVNPGRRRGGPGDAQPSCSAATSWAA